MVIEDEEIVKELECCIDDEIGCVGCILVLD